MDGTVDGLGSFDGGEVATPVEGFIMCAVLAGLVCLLSRGSWLGNITNQNLNTQAFLFFFCVVICDSEQVNVLGINS